MQKNKTLFLDFTGVYEGYDMSEYGSATRHDLSYVSGTNMYCSPEAREELLSVLKETGFGGIHFIDSGNYHYMTKLFADLIDRPFYLLLIDNHNDMQSPMLDGMLSCGSWAADLMNENGNLRQLILIGPEEYPAEDITSDGIPEKVIYFDKRAVESLLSEGESTDPLSLLDHSIPLYISIDKDVLSEDYARTNWDQGDMSEKRLCDILEYFVNSMEILGIDICGEDFPEPGLISDAQELNRGINKRLYEYLSQMMFS